jgi:hypothetical protein
MKLFNCKSLEYSILLNILWLKYELPKQYLPSIVCQFQDNLKNESKSVYYE